MRTEIYYGAEGVSLKALLWEKSEELAVLKRPAMLILPGGGYIMCSEREADPIALAYAGKGYQTFVLNYTCRSTFEKAMADADWAMELIHEKAEKFGINEAKISVCGFSAGGHLACALGNRGKIRPAAMVLGYPAVMRKFWVAYGNQGIPDMVDEISEATPPAFVFAANDDKTVPIENVIKLLEAMDKHGIPFESHVFHKGDHGFSLATEVTAVGDPNMISTRLARWVDLSAEWLFEVVGGLEIKERCTVLPEGLSEKMQWPFPKLIEADDTRKILLEANPVFGNDFLKQAAGDSTLAKVVLGIGMSKEDIISLSDMLG